MASTKFASYNNNNNNSNNTMTANNNFEYDEKTTIQQSCCCVASKKLVEVNKYEQETHVMRLDNSSKCTSLDYNTYI